MSIPLYQKIYDDIFESLKSGELVPGDRVMSEKELARDYGVSRITSKKALEMLAQNGYIKRMPGRGSFVQFAPGSSAKGGGRRWKIGVVMDSIKNVFGPGILLTIEGVAESKDFFLVPRFAYGRRDMEEKAIQSLMNFGVDGIILMTSHSEDITPSLMKLVLNKTPLVLVDRFLTGIPAPFVGTDNFGSTVKATDYLLNLGHRNISFVTRPYQNTMTIENRVDGFVRSHAEHGVAIDESKWVTDIMSIQPGQNSEESVRNDICKIKHVLISNKDLTCFFAAEHSVAVLIRKAVEEMNLRIPEDISVLCFDGSINSVGDSPFTHVAQDEQKIGLTAIQLLMDQIEKNIDRSDQKVFCDAQLVIGESTAIPRKK